MAISISIKKGITINTFLGLRERWKWKSSVERNATEIVADSATEFSTDCFVNSKQLNEGTPKGKI